MGRKLYGKHISTPVKRKVDIDLSDQKEITDYSNEKGRKNHLTERDIAIIKTVGSVLVPACAPFIETAYYIYKHRETIKKVTADLSEGDFASAAETIITRLTIDSVNYLISSVGEEIIEEVIDNSTEKLEKENIFEEASERVFNDKSHKGLIKDYYKKTLEKIIMEEKS